MCVCVCVCVCERERDRQTERRNASLIFTGFILLLLSMISTTIMTSLIIDFFFLAVANSGYIEIELSSLGLRQKGRQLYINSKNISDFPRLRRRIFFTFSSFGGPNFFRVFLDTLIGAQEDACRCDERMSYVVKNQGFKKRTAEWIMRHPRFG